MSRKSIENIIVDSLFLTESRPDCTVVAVEGIRGYLSPFKLAHSNRIRLVDKFNVDGSIQAAIDYFGKRSSAFTWVVSSADIEAGLPERLIRNGLTPARFHKIAGMYLECSVVTEEKNPAIRVKEITDDREQDIAMISRSYGYKDDAYTKYLYKSSSNLHSVRSRLYQAYLHDTNEPVGYAFCSYLENNSIVLMRGAGVVPEHRGKGVYKELFRQRLADACAEGVERFITQAARDTSYSTCRRLGFEEICPIEWYEWEPS